MHVPYIVVIKIDYIISYIEARTFLDTEYIRLFVWAFIKKLKAKNSKLKEVTENSSSNPKKSANLSKFLEIFL